MKMSCEIRHRLCILSLLIACNYFLACTTSQVSVKSLPLGAEVFSLKPSGERGASLGVTPLTVKDPSVIGFEVSKPGFTSVVAYVPAYGIARLQEYTIALPEISKEWLTSAMLSSNHEILSTSVSELLRYFQLIQEKNEKECEDFIQKNSEKYKSVAIFHLLTGNFYYTKKDFKKAREYFLAASVLEPKNEEAAEMVNLLKKLK
jgi:hypothetical protein